MRKCNARGARKVVCARALGGNCVELYESGNFQLSRAMQWEHRDARNRRCPPTSSNLNFSTKQTYKIIINCSFRLSCASLFTLFVHKTTRLMAFLCALASSTLTLLGMQSKSCCLSMLRWSSHERRALNAQFFKRADGKNLHETQWTQTFSAKSKNQQKTRRV